MAQAELLFIIPVITTLLVCRLIIPTGIEVFGQEQLKYSTSMESNSTHLQAPLTSPSSSVNQLPAWVNSFDLKNCDLTPSGANTYFILEPGYQLVMQGQEDLKPITLTITVLNETKLVNGTETRIVEEKTIEDGNLYEISNNYFATCKQTNDIFYFGEDTDFYKDGKIISHNGSWQAGIDNARAGMIMPGKVKLGLKYYQELAKGIDEGRAEIVSVDEVIDTPAGKFQQVLKSEESTPLEPGEREYKFYAPGIGLIQDNTLKLVNYTLPNPS
jgi:hypothetical protein